VSAVFDKMRKADIIIYGTPVYLFTMSGLLKIFLDRFYSTGDVYDLKVTKSGLFFHGPDVALTSISRYIRTQVSIEMRSVILD